MTGSKPLSYKQTRLGLQGLWLFSVTGKCPAKVLLGSLLVMGSPSTLLSSALGSDVIW